MRYFASVLQQTEEVSLKYSRCANHVLQITPACLGCDNLLEGVELCVCLLWGEKGFPRFKMCAAAVLMCGYSAETKDRFLTSSTLVSPQSACSCEFSEKWNTKRYSSYVDSLF